jgi:hypothetical protein
MKKHIVLGAVIGSALISCLAGDASPQIEVIATGLNSPRHLAFGPEGTLYVAEAGLGAGDGKGGFAVGVGFTASITEIRGVETAHPRAHKLVAGLASVGDTENGFPEALGPSGVAVHGNGGIYVTIGESALGVLADNPGLSAKARRQFGRLIKVTPAGTWRVVADVGDFDYLWTGANKDQPWAPEGQFPDANPYGVLAKPGRQYVADAGANTLNEVRADGSVRIIAYFPDPELPLPSGATVRVSDAVPTCVAEGPDGYLYVATLAFGANFARFGSNAPPNWKSLPSQSKVYRVAPDSSEKFLTEADVWASGFNPVTACAFGRGALYLTEYVTQDSGFQTGDVVRVTVNKDGSPGTRATLGTGALHQPNGLALGKNGAVYVSNFSIASGGGQVVRVNY